MCSDFLYSALNESGARGVITSSIKTNEHTKYNKKNKKNPTKVVVLNEVTANVIFVKRSSKYLIYKTIMSWNKRCQDELAR